ncbi:MAG TPA: zinc-binding dehydrogenase, partial [Chitinophagaceae bacterium]|nr:zinc-binding dehydrogenase [Chitinophagaceae bacterium]
GPVVPARIRPGELVTVSPYCHCGQCSACLQGRTNACSRNQTLGVQRDGAMVEWFSIPWEKVYPSSRLSPELLALTEPLCIGSHAAARGRVGPRDTVVVLGCGTIGMGALIACVELGARVIGVDFSPFKLDLAGEFGAIAALNPASSGFFQIMEDLTGGQGADVVIEAVGSAGTYRSAVELAAFGGRIVCIGYAREDILLQTALMVKKELDVLGSRNALGEFGGVIAMLESGKHPFEKLISAVYPLDQAPEAFRDWDKNQQGMMKVLLRTPQT